MVARQPDDVITSDVDRYPQGSMIYLCAKFCCSTSDSVGGVGGQRNKHTERDLVFYSEIIGIIINGISSSSSNCSSSDDGGSGSNIVVCLVDVFIWF